MQVLQPMIHRQIFGSLQLQGRGDHMQGYNKDYRYLGIQRIFRLVLQSDQNLLAFCFVHKYPSFLDSQHEEFKQTRISTTLLFLLDLFQSIALQTLATLHIRATKEKTGRLKLYCTDQIKGMIPCVRDSCNSTQHFLFPSDTYVQEPRDELLLSTEHLYPNH